jgi:hypothetical protein
MRSCGVDVRASLINLLNLNGKAESRRSVQHREEDMRIYMCPVYVSFRLKYQAWLTLSD